MIEGLGHLLVIDRLDVGPVELEDDKLTMPYAVTRKEDGVEITDATELVYKYQEPVFTKREDGTWDPHDVNLASLIGAQVALNYGLFAKEIRFRGPFDKNDRGFLRDMAANTAREIYVKKILEPNPFLTLAKHPTVRTRTYVQAELTFEGDDDPPSTTPWVRPEAERAIAVLSSGGKDSLLSTGLLEEIGQEVHPLFVNESGRHWFTALNGFRLMEDRHPDRTARVWTNSDRVFPWMLKHLPFVRPDHQRLRSDEYPIRLWTVAVFLFGVLPLMKKRGLDRLVIGDEFDTTVLARHEGIPHWNGLFDQSRIFDATLTRFFHKKGWKVHQFSILRPMSELLIQRTLMKRYPDLFAAQMSCHATHTEGDRVRPCGRCEKCRRIVGMVLSEGGDPEACGYTPGQIEPALSDLAKHGAHQEKDGVRHLAWSLIEKGLISRETPLAKIAKQMPHVVRLRFDSQVSPISDIPQDLRAPLYRIMLEHAEGAVRLEGRSWESFDLLAPNSLATPSAFARALQDQDDQIPPGRPTHRLAEKTVLSAGDLRVEQLVAHAGRPTDQRWLTEKLTAHGLEPMRLTTVTLTEAILGLAEAGEAVAVLSRTAAEGAVRAGRVRMLRIGQQGLRRRWELVTLATGVSALHVQCFASAVQQVAAESTGTPREPTTTKPSTNRVPKTA